MDFRVSALEPVDVAPVGRDLFTVDHPAFRQNFSAGAPGERDHYYVGIAVKPRRQFLEREMWNHIQPAGQGAHASGGGDGVDIVFACISKISFDHYQVSLIDTRLMREYRDIGVSNLFTVGDVRLTPMCCAHDFAA